MLHPAIARRKLLLLQAMTNFTTDTRILKTRSVKARSSQGAEGEPSGCLLFVSGIELPCLCFHLLSGTYIFLRSINVHAANHGGTGVHHTVSLAAEGFLRGKVSSIPTLRAVGCNKKILSVNVSRLNIAIGTIHASYVKFIWSNTTCNYITRCNLNAGWWL